MNNLLISSNLTSELRQWEFWRGNFSLFSRRMTRLTSWYVNYASLSRKTRVFFFKYFLSQHFWFPLTSIMFARCAAPNYPRGCHDDTFIWVYVYVCGHRSYRNESTFYFRESNDGDSPEAKFLFELFFLFFLLKLLLSTAVNLLLFAMA